MSKVIGINHVAIVVDDLDSALGFWRDSLGLELTRIENVPSQQSEVAFFPTKAGEIELVRPTTDDSGVARFLARRGPGMHHLCLEVHDIETMVQDLIQKGVRMINEEPTTGAGGNKIAFIHPESANGVLVELYETIS
jgi:methylmalonyl-CoA/ethylmalonyl-CoA epimerase